MEMIEPSGTHHLVKLLAHLKRPISPEMAARFVRQHRSIRSTAKHPADYANRVGLCASICSTDQRHKDQGLSKGQLTRA
jgi:hypothetical protein